MNIAIIVKAENPSRKFLLTPQKEPKPQQSGEYEIYLFQIGPTLYAFLLSEESTEGVDQVFVPLRPNEAISMVNDTSEGGEMVRWNIKELK